MRWPKTSINRFEYDAPVIADFHGKADATPTRSRM
jgi:hypothetical protein